MANAGQAGLYLYGVTRREAAAEPLHSQGVGGGGPVGFLIEGAVAAAVDSVSFQEFAPERVEERLRAGETGWVEEKALAHATVLQELLRRGPVVPVRFGILFQDQGRLLSILAAQEQKLAALLHLLAGKAEWGVRACYRDEVVKEALGREDPQVRSFKERLGRLPPGVAYLHSKKLEQLLEDRVRQCLPQWAQRVHEALAAASEAAEVVGVQQTEVEETVLFSGAYLVREEHTALFRDELDRLGDEFGRWGVWFNLSGPWPPYHFARMSLEKTP